jgi:hypothetical protein
MIILAAPKGKLVIPTGAMAAGKLSVSACDDGAIVQLRRRHCITDFTS